MAVDLRTVINTSFTPTQAGVVRRVLRGSTAITSANQNIFYGGLLGGDTNKAYIIATFRADTVYDQQGFNSYFSSSSIFVFDGGGQTGTLVWQVVEVF